MIDLILGSAVLFLPPQAQAGIIGGAFILNSIKNIRRRKSAKDESVHSRQPQEKVHLTWSEIKCTLKNKDGTSRELLSDLHGEARPGRVLAIFGPSGSGKTTLLNVLAGKLAYSPSLQLEGYLTANDEEMPSRNVRTGFVPQEDLFFSQMTVHETLTMAAELRTKGLSKQAKEELVTAIIRTLGLLKCKDTIVGDAKTRGLSGGERKRLSIACEMIGKPQLIMADEPTSGLDAFGAQQAVSALRNLASEGNTVILSIHQPRSSIYHMLDDICLLSEGKLIYFGPVNEALAYFKEQGYPCPPNFNPAEFLADLVAIDHSTPETEKECILRIEKLTEAWKSYSKVNRSNKAATKSIPNSSNRSGHNQPGFSLMRQMNLLFRRSWKQVSRDKATIISRASSQMSSALVFSTIYWKLGMKQSDIQSRLGLLQVSCIGTAMTSLIKTLNVFPTERTIIQRERSISAYPVIAYFASKLAAELPIGALFPVIFGTIMYPSTGLNPNPVCFAKYLGILVAESLAAQGLGLAVGAAAPSTSAALAIGPSVIMVSIVFGGLFVNVDGVPGPLKWIPRTSLIKHAFEGACINELRGLEFDCGVDNRGNLKTKSGEDVLQELGAETHKVRDTFVDQGRIILMYWWMAYRILQKRKPKYVLLKPPKAVAS